MLVVGTLFEGYHIRQLLGESPLASTFLAETAGHEQVVVKVFPEAIFAQEEGFSYLRRPREAITLGKITNQAYLSFYKKLATAEIPPRGRRAYLVRSYVEGVDLETWRQRPRTWVEIKDLLRKISLGLDHLHRAGLIHGGLCPQNILIANGAVKITDFGTSTSFLSLLLHQGEIAPEKRPFLPPWYTDPDRFPSPVTDLYAVGALLYLLEQGSPPTGIPADASLPVQKALRGEYQDVEEFWQAIEERENAEKEESREKPEELEGGEEEPEKPGEAEEEESSDRAPEPAPQIEISGEGLEPVVSGLIYRLEKKLKKRGQYSFIVRNLETEGRELAVRVRVVSGADWIGAEPQAVRLPPGEQAFQITFGPRQTAGLQEGKIVLEIPLNGTGNHITREILIKVEFKRRGLGWWKWAVIPLLVVPILLFFQEEFKLGWVYVQEYGARWWSEHEQTESIPPVPSLPHQAQEETAPVLPVSPPAPQVQEERPQAHKETPSTSPIPIFPPVPEKVDLTDQLNQIQHNWLVEGEYLDAHRELQALQTSYPENEELYTLLDRLERPLHIQSVLLLPPGQGSNQGEMLSIPSGGGFQFQFTPSDTCYLYIYQLDSYNNVAQLFPNPEATPETNPLQAGTMYQIPAGANWFILDQHSGQEMVYFVASRWPAQDLEELFERLSNTAQLAEKEAYRHKLIERLRVRAQTQATGVGGVFYQEYTFQHE
jgi:hypothetical protein